MDDSGRNVLGYVAVGIQVNAISEPRDSPQHK